MRERDEEGQSRMDVGCAVQPGGSWQRQCAVLVPVFPWASQIGLASKQQKPKPHSFLNVSTTVVKSQREFSRWIHARRFPVLFVYVSLFNLRPWNFEPLKVTPSQQHSQIKENRD